jgi:hypothetical protein
MNSNLNAARLLTAWSDLLGNKLPKKLLEAAAALEAAEYSQGPGVQFDATGVTPANAEAKVLELAESLATSEQFASARGKALDALGQHVLVTAGEVLPEVFKTIHPRLIAASESLAHALDLLPSNPTPEVLVSAGVPAVEAWTAAKQAEAELDALDRFVSSLSAVYGHPGEVTLRLLTPTTRGAFQTLLRAKEAKGAIRPLWVAGVQTPDVSWILNTPDQSKEIRRALDQAPPTEYKKPVFMKLGS